MNYTIMIPTKYDEVMLDFGESDESKHGIGSVCRAGIDADGKVFLPHVIDVPISDYPHWVAELITDWELHTIMVGYGSPEMALRLMFKRKPTGAPQRA